MRKLAFIIQNILFVIIGLSLITIVYNGSKHAVSDGVTPDNYLAVQKNIQVSGALLLCSTVLLIGIWIFF